VSLAAIVFILALDYIPFSENFLTLSHPSPLKNTRCTCYCWNRFLSFKWGTLVQQWWKRV